MPADYACNHPDRRSEPRYEDGRHIDLWLEASARATSSGVLLDRSAHGFRIRHTIKGLATGQTVHFEHPSLEGSARVVWTRIAGDHVESGFLILNAQPPRRSR